MCSFVLRCVALILAAAFPYLATFAQAAPVGSRVLYKQVDGHSLALYVDAPPAETSAHSAIVFFHGGAWTMGEVSQFNKQAAYLSSRGMTAIQVEYRLLDKKSSDSPRICVEDAKSAMRWVRSHAGEFGIDPGKIVAAGGSAGGYLAAVATMITGWDAPTDDLAVSPKGNVMVLFNPVMDGGPDGFGYKRFGELYRQYSPTYNVKEDMPPTLIQSGDVDKLVSPDSLRSFQRKAKAAGVRCELMFYAGQQHSFSPLSPTQHRAWRLRRTFSTRCICCFPVHPLPSYAAQPLIRTPRRVSLLRSAQTLQSPQICRPDAARRFIDGKP